MDKEEIALIAYRQLTAINLAITALKNHLAITKLVLGQK